MELTIESVEQITGSDIRVGDTIKSSVVRDWTLVEFVELSSTGNTVLTNLGRIGLRSQVKRACLAEPDPVVLWHVIEKVSYRDGDPLFVFSRSEGLPRDEAEELARRLDGSLLSDAVIVTECSGDSCFECSCLRTAAMR